MSRPDDSVDTVDRVTVAAAELVAPPEPVRLFGREFEYKWLVAGVLVSALFLDILDSTIVTARTPTLTAMKAVTRSARRWRG